MCFKKQIDKEKSNQINKEKQQQRKSWTKPNLSVIVVCGFSHLKSKVFFSSRVLISTRIIIKSKPVLKKTQLKFSSHVFSVSNDQHIYIY